MTSLTSSGRRYLFIVALLAFVAGLAVLLVCSEEASAACTPPGSGDWVVTSGETCTPAGPLTVNGDLIVQNGGNLTLNGVLVQMTGAFDGDRTIEVQNGGILNVISGSNITAANVNIQYKFLIRQGATVLISHSTIKYCGYGIADDEDLGMRVESNLVTITRSTFIDNYAGVYVKGVTIKIDNSTFRDGWVGVLISAPSTATIADSEFDSNTEGIKVLKADPRLLNNDVHDSIGNGIYLQGSAAVIEGNDIYDNDAGIYMISSRPLVKGNSMDTNEYGVIAYFSDPKIDDNDMYANIRTALYMVKTGGRIKGNDIIGPPIYVPVSGNGIYLRGATTAVTDNNITDTDFEAIKVVSRSEVIISGNRVLNYDIYGLRAEESKVTVTGNQIKHGSYAVIMWDCSGSFHDNTVENNTNGLDAMWLDRAFTIEGNSFIEHSKRALYLYECSPKVDRNDFQDNKEGIMAIYSMAWISNSTFTSNGISVDITSASDIVFVDNTVMHGNHTIFSTLSNATMVNNTIMFSANYSLYFTSKSYAKLVDNKINGNERRGVYFLRSDGLLINNSITDSGTGVHGFQAELEFERNTMYGNDIGISLNDSVATLKGDDLKGNNIYGLMGVGVTVSMRDVIIHDNVDGAFFQYADVWINNCTFANNTKGLTALIGTKASVRWSDFNDNEEDGLYIVESDIVIEGTTFRGNSYGVKSVRTPVLLRASDFITGARGIYIEDGDITIDDCSFELLNSTALIVVNGDVTIEDTDFLSNNIGLDIQNGTVTVSDCEVKDSIETGILTRDVTLSVEDTRIIGNMDGIIDLGGSHIAIVDCNISSNQMFGVYTDQNTEFVSMNITRKIIINDNSFLLAGDLVIEEGGHLVLLRVPFEFYSTDAGDSGVTVRTGGKFEAKEGLFSAFEEWSGYHFRAEVNSKLVIKNCTVRHIGRGMSGPSSGLLVETAYSEVADTYFENNTIGLYILRTSFFGHDLRFKDNNIGFTVEEGEMDLVNSTVEGSSEYDVMLVSSTARLLNTKIEYSRANLMDQGSLLIVKWYLHVTVVWDDGQPVEGASVLIEDNAKGLISATTNDQGIVRWLVVREYQQKGPDPASYFAFSPHRIIVTERDLTVEKSVYIGTTQTVTIKLVDDQPPVITVTDPVSGVILYDSRVVMLGTASDEASLVTSVEISIDGKNWFKANGTTFWSANVTLKEGNQTLYVRAIDARGNVGQTSVYVEIDLSSPLLVIYEPINGLVTNASLVHVRGKVHTGSQLIMNDDAVKIEPNGNFTYIFDLVEGENFLHAKALANNGLETMELDLVVVRDTTPPEIYMEHPEPGALMNSSIVTLSITSNEDAMFFISGVAVEAYGGVADVNLELVEGTNIIIVRAVDLAGNENTANFTIYVDVTPPDLVLEKPPQPVFSTTKERQRIMGQTEAGANLTINGEPVDLSANGTFSFKQKLRLGKNTLVLTSKDEAGNVNVMTLEIKRNEAVDNSNYLWLIVLCVIIIVVMDIAVIMFFKRFYRPKAGGGKGPKRGGGAGDDDDLDDELDDIEDDDIDEDVDERPAARSASKPARRYPSRPKPSPVRQQAPEDPGSEEGAEFEDMEDSEYIEEF